MKQKVGCVIIQAACAFCLNAKGNAKRKKGVLPDFAPRKGNSIRLNNIRTSAFYVA